MPFPGPILPILGPIIIAIVALLLGRWPRARTLAGVIGAFILAGWIASLSLDSRSVSGSFLFTGDTWLLWGRAFLLSEAVQNVLVFLWGGLGILFLFVLIFPQDSAFVPAAVTAFAPLAAALMVELFSFGAVFLVVAIALVVMTYKPQTPQNPYGALRYLIFFALALPLLLFVGWLFESRQATFVSPLVIRVLALAIALILAGFPFYIWVNPLVSEAPYFVPALLFGLVETVVITFLFSFLQANPWVQHDPQFQLWLRWSGTGTVLVAVVLVLTAVRWRSLMGYLLLFNMGLTFLALTLPEPQAWDVSLMAHVARFVSLLFAGMALSLLDRDVQIPVIAGSRGRGWQSPLSFSLLAYSFFSLVGTPLTLGFFPQWAIIAGIGQQANIWLSILLVLGLTSGVYAILRALIIPFGDRAGEAQLTQRNDQQWLNSLTVILLILAIALALLPQPLVAFVSRLTHTVSG